ncbi:uncharacterized protein LOC132033636 isoform X2 [Lycium ferocissimum]|uniref:uncharacterized protein LOC132033636 isoform X2 n=1 Tax=Lycium ferocissimum TaxID=112874 RepID=UPI0028162CEC|nr:uncharacterized protein LOC132033636 isoform X2 [Lycium ferocissimum]
MRWQCGSTWQLNANKFRVEGTLDFEQYLSNVSFKNYHASAPPVVYTLTYDDINLLGDETTEKKAAEAMEAGKVSTKKKESENSSISLDVKPWDD